MGNDLPVFVFGCLSCGKTVAGTEKSCPRCGASFEEVKFECPFCGNLISPRDMMCKECGTEFSKFAEEVADTSTIDLDSPESGLPPQGNGSEPARTEQMSYECPNCGKPVSENDVECPHCGVRFG